MVKCARNRADAAALGRLGVGGANAIGGVRAAPLAPRWRGGDHQEPAAGGSGRVGQEPRVDAPGVEPVPALREDADLIAVGELGEADGAVDQLDAARPGCGRGRSGCSGGGGGGGGGGGAGAAGDEGEAYDADDGAEERGEDDDDVGVNGR
ncbi:hypothetical protein B296_00019137 [Ensete ventricosum]|uniref:Uncharacterized protein n=1 Tax=Ensete ventricosum TaxID=4639 RepID=A0A427A7I3_ENSVE|nr:hypothetical protein B296_00019137 [Ensete ventricosum]